MKNVIILGRNILLQERNKKALKGITIGDSIAFRFFDGDYHGLAMLFAEPKGNAPSPRHLAITAANLSTNTGLPVVFLLPTRQAYERQRLIDKDVYFVVSDKYAHLPMLVANERIRRTKLAKRLNPVAQYLLLYHLQIESIEGKTARDLEILVPYSYACITLGITCLDDLGLCHKLSDGPKRKVIHFDMKGQELWNKAQPYLINPVEQRIFCDQLLSEEHFPVCGTNALAHYTMLNPDAERMVIMSAKQFRSMKAAGKFVGLNEYDGDVVIEVWKYQPIAHKEAIPNWVDQLSLAISLKEDTDSRVEGEVERLITHIQWKD